MHKKISKFKILHKYSIQKPKKTLVSHLDLIRYKHINLLKITQKNIQIKNKIKINYFYHFFYRIIFYQLISY